VRSAALSAEQEGVRFARPRAFAARLPVWARIATAALLTGLLAALDYVTGSELSFSIFYLIPIVFVTWYVGRAAGVVFAVVSAALWGTIDVAAGASYSSVVIPIWNVAVRLGFFLITMWLVSEVHGAHEREAILARHDSLTGLLNGREFDVYLRRELQRSRRTERPFALAYVDLDRFKSVNDTLGHAVGDDVLHAVAEALVRAVRETDVVARLGGDEFGLLLPETGGSEADATMVRVRELLRAALAAVGDLPTGVGATAGVMVFRASPASSDEALRLVDELMYEGKRGGRGRTVVRSWPQGVAASSEAGVL